MSLILANKDEIVVGKPPPWPLYDQTHNLLLDQGNIVRDDEHRDALLASGACHELAWKESGDGNNIDGDLSVAKETPAEQPGEGETNKCFTFDDMKLKAEDKLQLEPPAQLARERFLVKVIGYLRGASLLVTTPVTANGLRLQLLEGETVVMRSFSGQNAFGFACTIERVIKTPYEYLHLSFPDNIQGIVIRKAPRVKTRTIAAVQGRKSGTEQVSALISDISANGVSLDAKQPLGDKDDIINLAFRVHLHNIDAYLSVKGIIRAVLSGDAADASTSGIIHHGIEFQELQPNDSVILQSMIYQEMIENPHKLV
ncbi:MAG: flagellar brake protein [Gallionella sp.]|nr:flagellar brake protein [Gallionella sp.]